MTESTGTAKGQTTLPNGVRDIPNLKPGDKLRYLIVGGEVQILRPRKAISLASAVAHEGKARTIMVMDGAIIKRTAER